MMPFDTLHRGRPVRVLPLVVEHQSMAVIWPKPMRVQAGILGAHACCRLLSEAGNPVALLPIQPQGGAIGKQPPSRETLSLARGLRRSIELLLLVLRERFPAGEKSVAPSQASSSSAAAKPELLGESDPPCVCPSVVELSGATVATSCSRASKRVLLDPAQFAYESTDTDPVASAAKRAKPS